MGGPLERTVVIVDRNRSSRGCVAKLCDGPPAAPPQADRFGCIFGHLPRPLIPPTPSEVYPSTSSSCPEMIARAQLIDLLFVIAPHSLLLDIAGPAEAFRLANLHRGAQGLPPRFRLRYAGPTATAADLRRARAGRPRSAARPPEHARPGWCWSASRPRSSRRSRRRSPPRRSGSQLGSAEALLAEDTPHRLLAICSGALLAARGRPARHIAAAPRTTSCCPRLRALAPEARGDRQPRVRGGWPGRVQRRHHRGHRSGAASDCRGVRRGAGGQRRGGHGGLPAGARPATPSSRPSWQHRRHLHAAVHRVQDAIITRPEREWDMAALAAVGHATERHLLRLFIDHAGVSPLQYLRSSGSSAPDSRSNAARASPAPPRSRASARPCNSAVPGGASGADRRATWRARRRQSPRPHARHGSGGRAPAGDRDGADRLRCSHAG